MFTKSRWVAAGLAALLLASGALAQRRAVSVAGIQPYYQVTPGLNLQQAAYNTVVMGSALRAVPPYAVGYAPGYALGYNPGTQPSYYGPNFVNPYLYNPYNPYVNPGLNPAMTAGFNPYGSPYALDPYAALATSNPMLYGSTAGTAAMTSGAIPGNAGYDTTNPYGGYGYGGYNSYAPDPNTGFMRAAAEVINSQGRFRLSTEQARLMQQQVEKERIENRKRWVDEYLYEREHMPTPEDDRQRAQKIYLRRSLSDPPVNEILSAAALNALLDNLEKSIDKGTPAAMIPLDEDTLRQVNVTVPNGGNVGLLKGLRADGKLNWPAGLRGEDFQKDRERVDVLIPETVAMAREGKMDPGTLGELRTAIDRMRQQLSLNLRDLTPAQGIEARRYLSNLDDALRALERPNASNFLTREWAAKGANVAELVKNMKEKGLVFAPSVGGDESAYLALQRALAAYSAAVEARQSQQTAER